MSENKRGVGRPPKLDKDGKKILSAPISVNIAIGMIQWIEEQKQTNPKFNVSAFVVDLIQKSMSEGMCPDCYGSNLEEYTLGIGCVVCTNKRMKSSRKGNDGFDPNLVHYLKFFNCKNCDTPLDLWNKVVWFDTPDERIRGCGVCSRLKKVFDDKDKEILKGD